MIAALKELTTNTNMNGWYLNHTDELESGTVFRFHKRDEKEKFGLIVPHSYGSLQDKTEQALIILQDYIAEGY